MIRVGIVFCMVVLLTSCVSQTDRKENLKKIESIEQRYDTETLWNKRVQMVRSVSKFKSNPAKKFKLKALNDSHAKVRIAAIRGLSSINSDPKVAEVLRKKSITDKNENVRYEALVVLVFTKQAENFKIFNKYIRHRDWMFREIAYKGILTIRDDQIEDRSIPIIVRGLQDTSTSVQITILNSLHIQKIEIYNEIRKNLFVKDYQYKQTLLIATLEALKGYKLDIRVNERVEQLIMHQNREVRILALRVLKADPGYNKEP